MKASSPFEVQGHRGALGLLPENTLPGFELALDFGVHSIETDVLLTRDDVPVLFHDARISDRICIGPLTSAQPLVRSLTLAELRGCRIGGNARPMPLTERFTRERGIALYGIPMLAEFFAFVQAYAGSLGAQVGKTDLQRDRAARLIFDLELKREPFCPATVDDGFTGTAPALLEQRVLAAIHAAGVLGRTRVRSFDHRSVRAVKQLEPGLQAAVLIYNTVPAQIAPVLAAAQAELYCPDYHFVDAEVVRQVHAVGGRVIPYTVNEPDHWQTLVAWGVDGITTDYPDRLLRWLRRKRHLT
jgi:glycerophosphoryl diester phosphodiesterase